MIPSLFFQDMTKLVNSKGVRGSTFYDATEKTLFFTTLRGVYNFVGPPTPSLRPIECQPIEP